MLSNGQFGVTLTKHGEHREAKFHNDLNNNALSGQKINGA